VKISFDNLAIVAAVGFLTPLLLGFFPKLRLPSVAVELVAGITLGPSVLGWVSVDEPVQIFALVGVAFLLFIAGLEVDFDRLRGHLLESAGIGFALSFGLAIVIGFGLQAGGFVKSPLLIAIIFSATALGIVIPVLKDTGNVETSFGQLVIAGASIAEVFTIILLSLFFSEEGGGIGSQAVLLSIFFLLAIVVGIAVLRAEHFSRLTDVLLRLQDTTAQIRVRASFLLLAIFVTLSAKFGVEAILGAFMAGAIIKLVDRDVMLTHPTFRTKLEAAGFGVFIPFFFVSSGIRFNGHALFSSGAALAKIPLFLAVLLIARGVPALLYRKSASRGEMIAAGLLQATSLSFIVVAGQIGVELDLIRESTWAAMVAAGLISVLLFPLSALTILRGSGPRDTAEQAPASSPVVVR
jgi:Kef-type K+ transport system membrane component KefB